MDQHDASPEPSDVTVDALRQHIARLETRLAERERVVAEQRHLTDLLPLLVAKAGFDGRYQEVNATFERVLGWTTDELLARSFLEFIHVEDRAAARAAFERLKTGEPLREFLNRNLCRDGSSRWIRWIVTPIPAQEQIYGIGQDVTQWKLAEDDRGRAEQGIRQSEQRLRLHVQLTPLAVIEWTPQLCVSAWNPGAARIFGYTAAEALGRYFDFIVPAHQHSHVCGVFAALRSKRGGERSTNENRTRDGRTILCEWYNTPLVDAAGQVVGFASLAQDITEQVQAETALQQAHDELEQRIRERTVALENEHLALRRMMMANDHERRLVTYELHDGVAQQLTAATLQLQTLLQQLGHPPASAAAAGKATLEAVRCAAAELRGVMSRLRTPVLDKFGLVDAIADMQAQLQSGPPAPHIEFVSDVQFSRLEPTLENALYRIAQEALTNARRHSRSDRVRIELTQHENGGVLEVRDWGRGFDPRQVAEDHFGLEGIRERTRLFGGTCTIHSEPRQGTTVRVTFPVREQPTG